MRNYRKAFFLALVGNIVFAGALAGIWWSARRRGATQHPATPASNRATQPMQSGSPSTAPPPKDTPLVPVQLSAERLQSIGVKFGTVERKPVQDEIRATGSVAIDETRLSYVQTRFSGYIQKVFADATYKYVHKGQPLFTIYSPELAAPERENARLQTSGQVQEELEIDSPVSGYITERNVLPNLTVQPETRLYTIADLSTVWVLAQVFQNDLGRIRVGEPATIAVDSYPGRKFRGSVDFIYPDVDMTTRTARVRLILSNPNLALSPGMFVNVTLQIPLGNQLVIPANGVLQSGTRQIVFVDRGNGYLEPRDVQLGPQAGDQYIVLKGLKAGERIVTSANFLIDSESQLQAAIGSFVPPPPGAGAAAAMNGPAPEAATQIEFSTEPATPRKGANLYRVKLSAADGSPVTGAQVSARSYMPGMPQMGMAAMSVVSPLGEKGTGLYEGPANLESGGTWQVTITVTKNGAVIATKQLSL